LRVISLATREDRRAQFSVWNARAGIDIEYVDAVAGATLDRAALTVQRILTTSAKAFSQGALGNAISHRALWLSARTASQPTIIAEDDACLRGDFAVRAPALLRQLPIGWDIVFLGYNTDASIAVEGPEGIKAVFLFDDVAKKTPGYFDDFARKTAPAPASLACFQIWGTLCYAISPQGADRLLSSCFPLDASTDLVLFGQGRVIRPYTLDGMINVALQRQPLSAWCAYPPLALSLNDIAASDVVSR
jgi:GR25 family glycosyltransferase involved in LPS biosynthesis